MLPLKFTKTPLGSVIERKTLFKACKDWLIFLPSSIRWEIAAFARALDANVDIEVEEEVADVGRVAVFTFSLPAKSTNVKVDILLDTPSSVSISLSLPFLFIAFSFSELVSVCLSFSSSQSFSFIVSWLSMVRLFDVTQERRGIKRERT